MKRFLFPLLSFFLIPLKVSGSGYQINENMMTDAKEIYFIINSENKVRNVIGIEEYPSLLGSCINGKPGLMLSTPTYNGDSELLTQRWDKEKPKAEFWNGSSSGTAYFHRRPKKFINEMRTRDF